MKLFTFAIASIVDANTGYGLSADHRSNDIGTADKRGSEIRSRSILDLFSAIKTRFEPFLDGYRARARERRDLADLMRLNDRMLRDIGIQRGDLLAVKMGGLSLQELHRRHEAERQARLEAIDDSIQITRVDIREEAANARRFENQKCA